MSDDPAARSEQGDREPIPEIDVSLPFSSWYWALKRERTGVWPEVERQRQAFLAALRNAQRHEGDWAWAHAQRGQDIAALEARHAALMGLLRFDADGNLLPLAGGRGAGIDGEGR